MSEIEKMYENANIEKEVIKGCYEYYSELGIDIWKENDCGGKNCDTCKKDKSIKRYPPFTAEKQIEIVKTISTNHISSDYSYKYLGIDRDEIDEEIYLNLCIDGEKYHAHDKDFAVALAKLVNLIWQDLTEEERKQIKIILQEDNQ